MILDDYKYSINRLVIYVHDDPEHSLSEYGPGGPERTYGIISDVYSIDGTDPRWEYIIKNAFTGEERHVDENRIFHGANCGYLDMQRNDDIVWAAGPPESARDNIESSFWKRTLKQFVRTAIPRIREKEIADEHARSEGRHLELDAGDYIKIRGDLRPETGMYHNLYARILSVSASDKQYFDVPPHVHGIAAGMHRLLHSYHVQTDTGVEIDIYDIEVKAFYTTNSRNVVIHWRAATFLAEAFGDDPPYEVHLEYLNRHVFRRDELTDVTDEDLGNLLARLLFSKGMILRSELDQKAEMLSASPREYLVDQVLAMSRFDMGKNRSLTETEIGHMRLQDDRLRDLFDA